MPFDQTKQCNTTGYKNNCGLNCLSHFIIAKLNNNEFQLKYGADPEFKAAYDAFMTTFRSYYGLNRAVSWNELHTLFSEKVTDPVLQERVLGPVFRSHFRTVFMTPQGIESLWHIATGAITDYLQGYDTTDVGLAMIKANEQWFKALKAKYETLKKEIKQTPPSEAEIAAAKASLIYGSKNVNDAAIKDLVLFNRSNQILDQINTEAMQYWYTSGCQAYADLMANLDKQEMVSADQLMLLAQALKIDCEVYGPNSPRSPQNNKILEYPYLKDQDPDPKHWLLKVINLSAVHWEYEEPEGDENKAKAHNVPYSTVRKQNTLDRNAQTTIETIRGYLNPVEVVAAKSHKKAPHDKPARDPQSTAPKQPEPARQGHVDRQKILEAAEKRRKFNR